MASVRRTSASGSDATSGTGAAPARSSAKPRDEELDFFGMTHPGLVRRDNQDHYLVSTLHKTARVRSTSLPNPELFELPSQRLASFGMVADGVGGNHGGETASRAAVESIAEYVKETMNAFYSANENDEQAFLSALQDAANFCHRSVLERAKASGQPAAATTLTLFVAVWPTLYILHVGDSRFYLFRRGELRQLTKSFGGARALRGVDFTLEAGEVHALLGENGAGKSTLIKIVTGAHQPDTGTIMLNGQPMHGLTPASAHAAGARLGEETESGGCDAL